MGMTNTSAYGQERNTTNVLSMSLGLVLRDFSADFGMNRPIPVSLGGFEQSETEFRFHGRTSAGSLSVRFYLFNEPQRQFSQLPEHR